MTAQELGARGILEAYATGSLSPQECLEGARENSRKQNHDLNAFLCIDENPSVSTQAPGLLSNIPIAVKDNILVKGFPATAGSRILEGYRPTYEATVVERLRRAGGVILGKTNLDEFGMGSSNEYSAFGPVRNPWDVTRVPGGSSGGSAAAVAAGCVPAALGSDTGGSIRQPAAFCGIYGLKPTYGRVSRFGLVAFASSLDQIGPMARDLDTLARVFTVISGPDPRDSTTKPFGKANMMDAVAEGLVGMSAIRVGFPQRLLQDCEGEMQSCIQSVMMKMSGGCWKVADIGWPDPQQAISAYYVLATAEASSNLARYDGVRYGVRHPADSLEEMYKKTRSHGFGAEVKRRILLGTFVLSSGTYEKYYGRAMSAREDIKAQFQDLFQNSDVLVLPTTPTAPFPLGARLKDPLSMYLADTFTVGPSLAGIPALNVPVGTTSEGLPLGLQLVAPAGGEELLFRVAASLEAGLGLQNKIAGRSG